MCAFAQRVLVSLFSRVSKKSLFSGHTSLTSHIPILDEEKTNRNNFHSLTLEVAVFVIRIDATRDHTTHCEAGSGLTNFAVCICSYFFR